MGHMRASVVPLTGLSILLFGASSNAFRPQEVEGVAQKAASILQINCLKCHDSVKKTAGIDLSSRAFALAGALDSNDPLKSRLLREVSEGRMPPSGKLPDESIELLKKWVIAGATYPTGHISGHSRFNRLFLLCLGPACPGT